MSDQNKKQHDKTNEFCCPYCHQLCKDEDDLTFHILTRHTSSIDDIPGQATVQNDVART